MPSERVLLVESEAEIRDVLSRVLDRRGYDVVAAQSSSEAVATLIRDGFDYAVVLLRMTMDDGRATEVVELLARAPANGPALVLSGSQPTREAFEARVHCGGALFLVKPFSARELVRSVREAAASRMPAPSPLDSLPGFGQTAVAQVFDELPATPARPASLPSASLPPASLPPSAADFAAAEAPAASAPHRFAERLDGPDSLPPMRTPAPPSEVPEARARYETEEPHGLLAPEPMDDAAFEDVWPEPVAPAPALIESEVAPAAPEAAAAEPEAYAPPPGRPLAGSDTRNLLQGAPLFEASTEAAAGPWQPMAGGATVVQQAAVVDEDEGQFQLRPMTGNGTEQPRGTYGALSLPALLFATYRDMFTGRLVLQRGAVQKVILLAGGRPVGAESNIQSETLGNQLLESGHITQADHRDSLALAQSSGVRQGEALARLGVLTAEALAEHLRRQTQERILNSFAWVGGEYGLIYEPSIEGQQDGYEINPLQLVFAGTLSAIPVGPMLQHFDRTSKKFAQCTQRFEDYRSSLQPFEAQLAITPLCDGQHTFGQIVAESPLGLVETVRSLRALELLHCVAFTDEAVSLEPAAVVASAWPLPAAVEQPVASEPDSQAPRRHTTRPGDRRSVYRHTTGSRKVNTPSSAPAERARGRGRPTGEHRRVTSGDARQATPSAGARRITNTATPRRATRPGVYRSGRTTTRSPERVPANSVSPRRNSRSMSTLGSVPTPAPSEALSPSVLKKRLLAKFAALDAQNHYELLEVPLGVSNEDVRAAYQKLSRMMHQAAAHDQRLVEKATEVGRRLAEAASVLTDRRRKAEYDAINVTADAVPEIAPDAEKGQQQFVRGRACLDRKDYPTAFEHFELATRLRAQEPSYRMHRAFAKFMLSYPIHRKAAIEAHEDLKVALLEDSTSDDGFVLMAQLYQETGNVEMALKFYRKALSLNRRNRVAGEAMARLGTAGAEDSKGGLFGKLFKK
jgi:CheY-like chemotaxis protein